MYLGWVRGGIIGATLTGGIFILPSLLMVIALATFYLKFGNPPWIQALFYSIGAAVIGIIAKSAFQLTKKTVGSDWLLWIFFSVSAIVTVMTESELIWLFIVSGLVSVFIKAPPKFSKKSSAAVFFPVWRISGLDGTVTTSTLSRACPQFG
jgi:chromate transporter